MEVAEQVVREKNHLIAAPGCKVGLGAPLLVPFAWLLLELQHMLQDGMAPSITSLPRSRAKLGSALCQETGLFLITTKKKDLNLFPIFLQAGLQI